MNKKAHSKPTIRTLEKWFFKRFQLEARRKARLYARMYISQDQFLDLYLKLKARHGDRIQLRGDTVLVDGKLAFHSDVREVRSKYGHYEQML